VFVRMWGAAAAAALFVSPHVELHCLCICTIIKVALLNIKTLETASCILE
jgi:hypothetical protein